MLRLASSRNGTGPKGHRNLLPESAAADDADGQPAGAPLVWLVVGKGSGDIVHSLGIALAKNLEVAGIDPLGADLALDGRDVGTLAS